MWDYLISMWYHQINQGYNYQIFEDIYKWVEEIFKHLEIFKWIKDIFKHFKIFKNI